MQSDRKTVRRDMQSDRKTGSHDRHAVRRSDRPEHLQSDRQSVRKMGKQTQLKPVLN